MNNRSGETTGPGSCKRGAMHCILKNNSQDESKALLILMLLREYVKAYASWVGHRLYRPARTKTRIFIGSARG